MAPFILLEGDLFPKLIRIMKCARNANLYFVTAFGMARYNAVTANRVLILEI